MAKQTIKRYMDEGLTINEAFDEFILEKTALNLSRKTLIDYDSSMKHFKKELDIDGDIFLVEDIDAKAFYKWINVMKGRGIKDVTVNSHLALVRAFFYWCMSEERQYIKQPFKIKLLRVQEAAPKHYSEEEVEALTQKPKVMASFTEWRSWAVISFIIGTGARASTVCEVKMGDIDFTNKEITLGHTKNNKALIVPLSPALESVLKEYIRIWRRTALPTSWLFPTRANSQLNANSLWAGTERFFRIRGVDKTSIHGLRHTFAVGWVRNNGNMFALQKILGHSCLDMTRKYVKLFAEDIKVDFELYNPLDTIKRNKNKKQTIKKSV